MKELRVNRIRKIKIKRKLVETGNQEEIEEAEEKKDVDSRNKIFDTVTHEISLKDFT